MKIPSQRRAREREKERYEKWHDWFAWYPVRLDDDRVVWLETIRRRIEYGYGPYGWRPMSEEYEEKEN